VGLPWYLLRALVGLFPGLAVGTSVGLFAYWLIQRLSNWNLAVVGAVAVGVALLLTWFGPGGTATRFGQRLVLRRLTPTWWDRALIVVACLVGAVTLAWPVLRS